MGAPKLHGRGFGDEYVRINIETPTRLNREQRRLIEELREEGL
jgi:DnaJ-class molecular chaperone